MRRLLLLSAFLLPALLFPKPAAAMRFEEVIFFGGCLEWSAELLVNLRTAMTEADITYEVKLVDSAGSVVLAAAGASVAIDEDGDHSATLLLSGTWDEVTDETIDLYGIYTIEATFIMYMPHYDYFIEFVHEDAVTVECAVVPNDDVSWSDFKSHYR